MWTPEPKDKLDAMTMQMQRTGQPADSVLGTANGPEGVAPDWPLIQWHVEDDVRRLRRRIFTATQAGVCVPKMSSVLVATRD